MGKLRSVNTNFWSDPFIEELNPSNKLLFLYLITNEKTNMLGIYEASLKKMAFETGLTIEMVRKGLERFETLNKVKYLDNKFVVLINYMKHQNYNTNMKKSAIDVYNSLPNSLKINGLEISKSNPLKAFESLSNHFGMVRKVEVEVEVEVEKEDTLHDFSEEKPSVKKFGFKNIEFETDKELLNRQIEGLYQLYPTKCPFKNRSTGKSKKDKEKIKKLLKDYTILELKSIFDFYIKDCNNSETYYGNLSTFLNNLPEVPTKEEVLKLNSIDPYAGYPRN